MRLKGSKARDKQSGDMVMFGSHLKCWNSHTVGHIRLVGLQQCNKGQQLVSTTLAFICSCKDRHTVIRLQTHAVCPRVCVISSATAMTMCCSGVCKCMWGDVLMVLILPGWLLSWSGTCSTSGSLAKTLVGWITTPCLFLV